MADTLVYQVSKQEEIVAASLSECEVKGIIKIDTLNEWQQI